MTKIPINPAFYLFKVRFGYFFLTYFDTLSVKNAFIDYEKHP